MRCPRCGGALATFAIEGADESAVVCDSCGFVGVPASHHPERADEESWERAIERFDEARLPPERTCQTGRAEGVTTPRTDAGPDIDPDRLEESVSVATSLRENGDAAEESGEDGEE